MCFACGSTFKKQEQAKRERKKQERKEQESDYIHYIVI